MRYWVAVALLVLCCGGARAEEGVSLEQRLGARIPLELRFFDEEGHAVPLSTYFGKRPVILVLAYYQCPMLCTQVLSGLTYALQDVPLRMGRDFEVVTVSIDPSERPQLAALKKKSYVLRYGRPGGVEGWHFLTGRPAEIAALARAVGFHYRFDPHSGQFAHASGIMLATPDGVLSRYYYGISYDAESLRLGLVDASRGKLGSVADQVLLLCFHYDPMKGRFGFAVLNVVRLLSALTLFALGWFAWSARRRHG